MNTPKDKAQEILSYYRNYRFYIAEMDCRNMAMNQVRHTIEVLDGCNCTGGEKEFYQQVLKELQQP